MTYANHILRRYRCATNQPSNGWVVIAVLALLRQDRSEQMKFLFGVVVGLLILPAFAFLYLRLGYAPVATAAPPLPLEKTVTGMALDARVAKEAPTQSPISTTEPNLMSGAKTYRRYCSECH